MRHMTMRGLRLDTPAITVLLHLSVCLTRQVPLPLPLDLHVGIRPTKGNLPLQLGLR